MTGELLSELRQTAHEVTSDSGFETELTITDNAGTTATVNGIVTLHHTSIDPQSMLQVSGRQAHAVISISELTSAGLSLFSDSKKPNITVLKGFTVTFIDVAGNSQTFAVGDSRPSLTFGLITCTLVDKR